MKITTSFQQLLICLLLLITNGAVSAQKQFKLIVNLPAEIDKSNIEFYLEDGKSNFKMKSVSASGNQLTATGEYFGLYAAINIQRPQVGSAESFVNTFFVQEKTGIITFSKKDPSDLSLNNYSLENVEDFKEEKQSRKKHSSKELKDAIDFEAVYLASIIYGTDMAITNKHNDLLKALGRKDIEYINAHLNSYYSFYFFKNDISVSSRLPGDSLMMVFNKFPEKYRLSDEGNLCLQFIVGRSTFTGNETPIEFSARDIHGKNIRLADYRNKKMVLLHFWGTWCSPCIEELPALKKIREQYRPDQLEIISITVSSKDSDFFRIIKKYEMDWSHIHNNDDLYYIYGAMGTPRICLINKDLKVIYDSVTPGKEDNLTLTKLNKMLSETLH
ncbi:TlpA disulfide reductase family protein [Pollutibacter soli]|uniref:TlpA family protein disulfide reductase n=1 Tax=Pollutibacter soli TaxID=3034157 RepID=UPI00301343FA